MPVLIKFHLAAGIRWLGKDDKLTADRRHAKIFKTQQAAEQLRQGLIKTFGNIKIEMVERQVRPAYANAIAYIALNDDPTCVDLTQVSRLITVNLTANLWDLETDAVAWDVIAYRKNKIAG